MDGPAHFVCPDPRRNNRQRKRYLFELLSRCASLLHHSRTHRLCSILACNSYALDDLSNGTLCSPLDLALAPPLDYSGTNLGFPYERFATPLRRRALARLGQQLRRTLLSLQVPL